MRKISVLLVVFTLLAVTVISSGCTCIGEKAKESTVAPAPVIIVQNKGAINTDLTKDVQLMLKDMGYYNDRIDGVFGPKTKTALESFGKDNNLPKFKSVRPYVSKLVEKYQKRIREAQSAINEIASANPDISFKIEVNGIKGTDMEKAIRLFQGLNDLKETGFLNEETWNKLWERAMSAANKSTPAVVDE